MADVDYRLSREAAFPAHLHNVKAAVRWLRGFAADLDLDLDPRRITAVGESAGGHLAAMVGLTADAEDGLEGQVGLRGIFSGVQAVVDW